jgi:hypothetical protein
MMRAWMNARRFSLAMLPAALLLSACHRDSDRVEMNTPEMAAFVELMMPQKIEIQSFTQPVSRSGDGKADTIEAIVAATDSSGDYAKVAGHFQFELRKRRLPSGPDLTGERLAYWRVPIQTQEQCAEHWSRYSRFYRFPLSLEMETLPAGEYLLEAQFTGPTGNHYFDEFVIHYDGTPVPPLQPRY